MEYFKSQIEALKLNLGKRRKPWLVLLEGPLGAGKTTFTKEYLGSLGFPANEVQSPSFLKVLEYPIPGLGLCLHLDTYRMSDVMEFNRLGLEAYEDIALIVVEWPSLFLEALDRDLPFKKIWAFQQATLLKFSVEGLERMVKISTIDL